VFSRHTQIRYVFYKNPDGKTRYFDAVANTTLCPEKGSENVYSPTVSLSCLAFSRIPDEQLVYGAKRGLETTKSCAVPVIRKTKIVRFKAVFSFLSANFLYP